MSSFDRSVSRRKFLITAGASAVGSVLLHGCLGNPPDSLTKSQSVQPVAAANLSPEQKPETTAIKLGYIPIIESAPLIIAKEKGFFAKHGMTDVSLDKQSSWGTMRDNTETGVEGGGVHGGQYQMPMPHLISEGIITKGNKKIPMYNLLQLVTHGNGIAVANKYREAGFALNASQAKELISKEKSVGSQFVAAHTFPHVNQDFWIRYWFAAGGIDPDNDISLLPVPSAQTVANMKTGTMGAFSTGDPWPYRIVADKIGFMAALTAEIWKEHPEEYLALRADWVDKNPKATKAVLKAVMEAQQWCDDFNNRQELSEILAGRQYFNVPVNVLLDPFMGKIDMGTGRVINDRSMAPLYWKGEKSSVSYPFKSHELWFLTESVRWNFLPPDTLARAKTIIDAVNREDLWREAAKELGVPAADIPQNTSRGVETFFDGIQFDPENPQAYLDSLQIKRI
jgi:bicarbonate transport system substrate-binding protein